MPPASISGGREQAVDADAREVAQQVLAGAAATDDPAVRIEGARDLLVKTGGGGRGDREQLASHLQAMASLLRDVELLFDPRESRRGRQRRRAAVSGPADEVVWRRPRLRAFAAVDRALEALESNAGVKIVADWLVLQL